MAKPGTGVVKRCAERQYEMPLIPTVMADKCLNVYEWILCRPYR